MLTFAYHVQNTVLSLFTYMIYIWKINKCYDKHHCPHFEDEEIET